MSEPRYTVKITVSLADPNYRQGKNRDVIHDQNIKVSLANPTDPNAGYKVHFPEGVYLTNKTYDAEE